MTLTIQCSRKSLTVCLSSCAIVILFHMFWDYVFYMVSNSVLSLIYYKHVGCRLIVVVVVCWGVVWMCVCEPMRLVAVALLKLLDVVKMFL